MYKFLLKIIKIDCKKYILYTFVNFCSNQEMGLILNIETSTSVCSVCLAENGKKIIGKETCEQNAHSKILTVFIEEIFKEIK